jgi:hypothetical protein
MWPWVTAPWDSIASLSSDNWQAIGSMGTLGVAVVAAVFAKNQVQEARRVREEQSQPQVIVDFEPHSILMQIVVTNTGATTARSVKVAFDPPLTSTLIETRKTMLLDAKILTDGIASLPPGKTYKLLFERTPDRYDRPDLPRSYTATASWVHGKKKFEEVYILDFDIYYGYNSVQVYGVHDAAKALRDMRSTMKDWSGYGGFKAVVRDGDKVDERDRQAFRQVQRADQWESVRTRLSSLRLPFRHRRPDGS